MADIVNTGVMTGNVDFIIKTGAIMILITLLGTAASVVVGFLSARAAVSADRIAEVKARGDIEIRRPGLRRGLVRL